MAKQKIAIKTRMEEARQLEREGKNADALKIYHAADKVFERPLPELHSVAELISPVLVWRIESIRKLKDLDANLTVDSPENWRTNEQLKEIGWLNLQKEFYQSIYTLIEMLSDKDDTFLENKYRDGYSFKYLIEGLIHHDLYHLGQLGITIKFLNLQHDVKLER